MEWGSLYISLGKAVGLATALFHLIAVAHNPLPRAGRRHHHHRHAPRARGSRQRRWSTLNTFVPREQIDQRYLDTPDDITPDGQVGQDAFAVIREAMRGKGMVALGRVVLAKRERVIMLEPRDKGLTATTLRYPYEIRDAKEYFDDIPDVRVETDMLKLAEHILQSKATDFDPLQFVDSYEEAVIAMLKKKQAGLPVSRERATPRPQSAVNLMEALRLSIAQERKATADPSKKARKRIDADRARCCFPFQARRASKPQQSQPSEQRSS